MLSFTDFNIGHSYPGNEAAVMIDFIPFKPVDFSELGLSDSSLFTNSRFNLYFKTTLHSIYLQL